MIRALPLAVVVAALAVGVAWAAGSGGARVWGVEGAHAGVVSVPTSLSQRPGARRGHSAHGALVGPPGYGGT